MNVLKEVRISKKKTIEDLADAVKVSKRHISFIETGKRNPSLELAFEIAHYFKMTVDEIFLPRNCTNSTVK
ncbi:MAG: helix-turn-helix transcriptional regulator [Desulfitobacteriaceae bacterium]|nr:helix-turn-helix transcriptional regulator [Desulfitobacteriaceae bacterium]